MNFQRKFEVAFVGAMIFLLLLFASCPPKAHGQSSKPNVFRTSDACVAGYLSGNFTFYEPTHFGLKSKNPVNGKDRILAPLESDACLRVLTVSGVAWAPEPKGTQLRWWANKDGSLKEPYAMEVCGNMVYDVVYPSLVKTTPDPASRARDAAPIALEPPANLPPPPQYQEVQYAPSQQQVVQTCSWVRQFFIGCPVMETIPSMYSGEVIFVGGYMYTFYSDHHYHRGGYDRRDYSYQGRGHQPRPVRPTPRPPGGGTGGTTNTGGALARRSTNNAARSSTTRSYNSGARAAYATPARGFSGGFHGGGGRR
jgi:hypothetical protein